MRSSQLSADPELLHIVAMSANDGIWDWNIVDSTVYYSSRWLELVGEHAEAGPSHINTFLSRLHDQDWPRVIDSIDAYLNGRAEEYRVEFRLKHHDGGWRWILSRGAVLRDAQGRAVRLAGTHTDITDRVLNAERLEALVAQRTRELEAARDRAQSNAAATAKFLASTSHDISQPLQAAVLLIGTLRQEVHTFAGHEMLQAVEHSMQACMELLESLLEFSRLDAGALRPHIAAVHAGEVIAAVATQLQAQALRRGIQLRVVPNRQLVSTDPRLLGRILRNLVSNALKYTSSGKVLIGCRRKGTRLRIEVWDTGRGIPANQLKQIFREFVRLPDGRDSFSPGLGLGLAIVRRLAKLLGHTVTVRSTPGRGSVFSIEVQVVDKSGRGKASARSEARPRLPALLPPRRVALLEDDPDIADGLARTLQACGWQVWHGTTLPELLQRLGDVIPELVIADWHINGPMDGFDAYDELERRFGPLPGLMLTGHYDASELATRNGARRKVLFKPVMPAALHAVLHSLSASGQGSETPGP